MHPRKCRGNRGEIALLSNTRKWGGDHGDFNICFVICFFVCLVVLIFTRARVSLAPLPYTFIPRRSRGGYKSKGRASLRPSGDKKKRGKMNWWVEKNRSKTGKSGLKKMAKNGQKLPKKRQKLIKGKCDARARAARAAPRCLEGFDLKKKMKKRKDGIFGLVRGFKQKKK